MVLPALRQQPHVSFTQIDQYLRCPLKYKFTYVDRVTPDFVPAALAFGSGIHGAAALLFGGIAAGTPPTLDEVQGYFETYRNYVGDRCQAGQGDRSVCRQFGPAGAPSVACAGLGMVGRGAWPAAGPVRGVIDRDI